MRASVRALLIAVSMVLILGCATSPTASSEVRVATSTQGAFDVGCPAALIEGELIADESSGTAIHNASGWTDVVWPFGFSARLVDQRSEVVDAAGSTVAKTGETVKLSGGMITGDGRWSTCGPPLERR